MLFPPLFLQTHGQIHNFVRVTGHRVGKATSRRRNGNAWLLRTGLPGHDLPSLACLVIPSARRRRGSGRTAHQAPLLGLLTAKCSTKFSRQISLEIGCSFARPRGCWSCAVPLPRTDDTSCGKKDVRLQGPGFKPTAFFGCRDVVCQEGLETFLAQNGVLAIESHVGVAVCL